MVTSLHLKGKPALLIVDMQNTFCHPSGIFASTTAAIPATIISNVTADIQKLRNTFHKRDLPVIFVGYVWASDYSNSGILLDELPHLKTLGCCVEGSWDAQIIDELKPDRGEIFLPKTKNSAFFETGLSERLRGMEVENVVVTGVSTNVCVESTSRDARSYGFGVKTVGDATGALSEEEQRGAERSLMWFGGVAKTSEVVEALERV